MRSLAFSKMKLIPFTYCFKFIAVSLLLYINRLSSAAVEVESR